MKITSDFAIFANSDLFEAFVRSAAAVDCGLENYLKYTKPVVKIKSLKLCRKSICRLDVFGPSTIVVICYGVEAHDVPQQMTFSSSNLS